MIKLNKCFSESISESVSMMHIKSSLELSILTVLKQVYKIKISTNPHYRNITSFTKHIGIDEIIFSNIY